jgi:hypothetical protein
VKGNKVYVTINCDAGFKDGVVTYGGWISYEGGPYKFHGTAKEKYNNSTEAELVAICTSIYKLQKLEAWHNCDILVINTDSVRALGILKHKKQKHHQKFVDFFYNIIEDMRMKRDFVLVLRHVKGHSKKDTESKRKWVNNWCDSQATKIRKEIEKKEKEIK